MKRLLIALLLALGIPSLASAQCVGVGGVNTVPQTGVSCASEPTVPTYASTAVGVIPGAAATDIACLTGSATRIIRVQNIRVDGTGTAITVPVLIKKNASADTGGTATVTTAIPVPYPLDSNNPTVSATAIAYTSNPTINDAAPGTIDSAILPLGATTVSTGLAFLNFDYYGRQYMQAPTLRGVAQQICVNLNGTSPTALLNITFRWTESPQ